MGLKIIYTSEAKASLKAVYNFIRLEFGDKSANKFKAKAENIIELISSNPLMFKSTIISENIRVALIAKQCSLFYEVAQDHIGLLFFWDNRQDPLFN